MYVTQSIVYTLYVCMYCIIFYIIINYGDVVGDVVVWYIIFMID